MQKCTPGCYNPDNNFYSKIIETPFTRPQDEVYRIVGKDNYTDAALLLALGGRGLPQLSPTDTALMLAMGNRENFGRPVPWESGSVTVAPLVAEQ